MALMRMQLRASCRRRKGRGPSLARGLQASLGRVSSAPATPTMKWPQTVEVEDCCQCEELQMDRSRRVSDPRRRSLVGGTEAARAALVVAAMAPSAAWEEQSVASGLLAAAVLPVEAAVVSVLLVAEAAVLPAAAAAFAACSAAVTAASPERPSPARAHLA